MLRLPLATALAFSASPLSSIFDNGGQKHGTSRLWCTQGRR